MPMYTVYGIYNKKHQKIYIGQTVDLEMRLDQHSQKKFRGYTSRFDGAWDLIYSEETVSRADAIRREKELKSFQGRKFIKQRIPA